MALECVNFDLFCVFVEVIFGSILISFFGLAFIMVMMMFISRVSPLMVFYFVGTFAFVFLSLYAGTGISIIMFIMALIFFISGIVSLFRRWSNG